MGRRFLRKDFINYCVKEYNEEKWIGFNKENEFLTKIPDVQVLGNNNIFFPGTAYNLNFVMAVDKSNS